MMKHPAGLLVLVVLSASRIGCRAGTPAAASPSPAPRSAETSYDAPGEWFPFVPGTDAFGAASLDLRGLNERVAGEGGFIQASGDHFIRQRNGRPIRFWGVNARHQLLEQDGPALDRFARHLAKVGVNLVRLHGPLWRDDDLTRIDTARLAKIHRLVAALEKQGIYFELSSYFPLWLRPKSVPGLPGYAGDKNPFGMAFFNARFQEIQRGWWKSALTAKNPFTGRSLVEDPAVAFIEIQNEDGLFFWTFQPYDGVPAAEMEILEKQFGAWLAARFGGLAQAFARWKGSPVRGDDVAAGRAGFMPLWDLTARRDARAQDTARFLTELQRKYYDGMYAFLKRDLGFKGSVTASNWVTADGRRLGPLDKWSNAGADFMDRHGYYGGPHEGDTAAWALAKGDRYRDVSALRFEAGKNGFSFDLPLMDVAYNGKPSAISEINWPMPNRYRAEMAPLCAAYGALQGTDAFMFFTTEEPEWAGELDKFRLADPAIMGTFPGAALLFRNGLVKTGAPVVHLEVALEELLTLNGLPLAAPENLDDLRKWHLPWTRPGGPPEPNAIDPLSFLVGRVEVNITTKAVTSPSTILPLSRFIDRERRVVRSASGELSWDWGKGIATVDAPAAQGATGFLAAAGPIALADVTIASGMEYGSVLVVALDGVPLRASRKMLVQVMSEDRNQGWRAPVGEVAGSPEFRTIADVGTSPIVVRKFSGTVSLARGDASSLRVTALDFNGYPGHPGYPIDDRSAAPVVPGNPHAGDITLLPTTPYLLIEK